MAAGRKNKKRKIAEVNTMTNVYQCPDYAHTYLYTASGEQLNIPGKWNEIVFKNNQPITAELACGRGEYSVALAARYPTRNFLGIDIKGPRLLDGAKEALALNLHNVAFARFKIENILHFIAPAEVDELWITFPDPYPKDRHEKHRLTYAAFLDRYKKILKPNGIIHFKTDNLDLFHYTRDSIKAYGTNLLHYQENIYAAPLALEELAIKTYYEKKFMATGSTIHYLSFSF